MPGCFGDSLAPPLRGVPPGRSRTSTDPPSAWTVPGDVRRREGAASIDQCLDCLIGQYNSGSEAAEINDGFSPNASALRARSKRDRTPRVFPVPARHAFEQDRKHQGG